MEKRFRKTVDFLDKIYNFEEVDRPAYVISPGVTYRYEDFERVYRNPRLQLSIQMEEIKVHEENNIEDDYIPMLMPGFGAVGMAEGFGGKVLWFKKDHPKILPVLKSAKDIKKLKKPDVKAGLMGEILKMSKYFQQETDFRYPICEGEHYTPVELAFELIDTTNGIYAMMDEPKLMHDLLAMITETIFDFVEEQRKVVKEYVFGKILGSTGIYIKEGNGIYLCEDSMVNLSPELFREFSLPYLNIISERFGGLFLHSCGDFKHQIDNIKLIKNLKGINFGASEISYELIVENFSGKAVIAPHLGLNIRIKFKSLEDFAEYIMKKRKMNTGNYFQIQDVNSIGYGDDVVDKAGFFNSTLLDKKRIKGLVNILKNH